MVPDDPSARIVVGVDGSPGGDKALRWAVAEAERRGAMLHIVVAAWYTPLWSITAPIPAVELTESATPILSRAVDEARAQWPDVLIRQDIVVEPPARALIEASEKASLLVVGSRGHGGFAGLLLGSVSQHCIVHASCPVVVVPADERPPAP
jgi:nucleotide-binding universal stress UspA family protein